MRSPFRYPGGKTWLVPRIRQWLGSKKLPPAEFIEPFAGGGIVSLTVAFEQLADRITMVELDEQVAAVWQTILSEDCQWLANRIATFDLSPDSVEEVLSQPALENRERAFQTILKNRINRGGILAAGAGRIKHGENGKGLKSRWYPETLKRRILEISAIRDRIQFIAADGMEVLLQNAKRGDVAFFIDPPYTAAGKKAGRRLYSYWELDHEKLFAIANSLGGDFLMSYDNTEEIRSLAGRYGFNVQAVGMKSTHHARLTELLIGKVI